MQPHPSGLDLGEVQNIIDQGQQVFSRSLNFLQILDVLDFPHFLRFFLQHFAIANDCVERSAQFVAHIREERALGPVGILGGKLGAKQFLLHLLAVSDFPFQLQGPGLQLIVGVVQSHIPMLDFGQHRIESVDQPADFVAVEFGGANLVAFLGGDHSHRVFQMQNWPGNQILELEETSSAKKPEIKTKLRRILAYRLAREFHWRMSDCRNNVPTAPRSA